MRVTPSTDSRNGFTLMELLTVMAIMGILLTAGVVSYVGARRGAEMRGAVGSIRAALTMARQHAVTKRHTTAALFRLEGGTNCMYVFAKAGVAVQSSGNILTIPASVGVSFSWPDEREYVCNMNGRAEGSIGRLGPFSGAADQRATQWLATETGGAKWTSGDSFGFLVGEKFFMPPGIECKVKRPRGMMSDNEMILFYPNGKSVGMGEWTIQLNDKMGDVTKIVTVYPLLGLVKSD